MAEPDIDLFSSLLGDSPAPEDTSINGLRAIDADTYVDEEGNTIRIAGVDAPETGKILPSAGKHQPQQAGADLATEFLREVFAEGGVEQELTGAQTYGRQVAKVTDAQGRDVGERMIERGFARPTMFSEKEQRLAERTANVRLSGVYDEAFSDEDLIKNRQLEYEKEIAGFDPSYTGVATAPESARGTFTRAVSRGVDTTQGLLYAASNAIGEVTGVDALAEWGEEGMIRNMHEAALAPAEIGEFDNVEGLADFGTYVLEAIGEQVPNIALTASGAGAAALTARAAIGKALLKKAGTRFAGLQPVGEAANVMKGIIAKEAAKELPEALAKSALVRGAPLAGAAATSYPLGVGEVQQELKGAGIDAPGTALVAGLPIAALDAASFDIIFGNLFRGVKRELAEDLVSGTASALGFIKDVGRGGLVGGLTEMPTEVMQELITITAHAYHDPSYEIFSDENLHRLRETSIKAGIVGVAGGGFASGVQSIRELPIAPPTEPTEEFVEQPIEGMPEAPIEPEVTSEEVVSEIDPLESVPEDFKLDLEGKQVPAREFIQTEFDKPKEAYQALLDCMSS